MKLASIRNGHRDGRLSIVSRDMQRICDASTIAATLQSALDNWSSAAPRLQALADALERGETHSHPFDARQCQAPLARAYQWLDGSVYLNHVELTRRAGAATGCPWIPSSISISSTARPISSAPITACRR